MNYFVISIYALLIPKSALAQGGIFCQEADKI